MPGTLNPFGANRNKRGRLSDLTCEAADRIATSYAVSEQISGLDDAPLWAAGRRPTVDG